MKMTGNKIIENGLGITKTMLVVVDEHTLGYIFPQSFNVGILHTSVLKGSYLNAFSSHIDYRYHNVRLATEEDFNDYRCVFGSFKNREEYEYSTSTEHIYINKMLKS